MLIYFRWCQSFHYQPHFAEVYSLAIKMPEARGLDWTTGSCLRPFPASRQGRPGRAFWPACPGTKAGVGGCRALTGGEGKTGPPPAGHRAGRSKRLPRPGCRKLARPVLWVGGLPVGKMRVCLGVSWATINLPQKCPFQGPLGALWASPRTRRPDRPLSDCLPHEEA